MTTHTSHTPVASIAPLCLELPPASIQPAVGKPAPCTILVRGQRIPVSRAVYQAYHQSREHERYQHNRSMRADASLERLADAGFAVEDHIRLPENEVDKRHRSRLLHQAMATLEPQMAEALWALTSGETTERALAERWGISRSAVHKRKVKALGALKCILEPALDKVPLTCSP